MVLIRELTEAEEASFEVGAAIPPPTTFSFFGGCSTNSTSMQGAISGRVSRGKFNRNHWIDRTAQEKMADARAARREARLAKMTKVCC